MSDAAGQQHEPSMEEILASIRRIIAEDGEPAVAASGAPPSAAKLEAKPAAEPAADEILELTEVVEAESAPAASPPPPAQAAAPVIPLPQRAPEPPRPVEEPATAGEGIVSPAAAAASVAALSQITALSSRPEPRGDIGVGAGHLTLEMLVREELRPILKDWLDRNLPEMVQRLVSQEIARLVGNVPRR